jgi:hypothetical protein
MVEDHDVIAVSGLRTNAAISPIPSGSAEVTVDCNFLSCFLAA